MEPSLHPDDQPTEHYPFGFDLAKGSETALAFTKEIRRVRWFVGPGGQIDPIEDNPRTAAGLMIQPLTDWERAMNPTRLRFEEFDRMPWLKTLDPYSRVAWENDTMTSAISLVSSLGWVLRFWGAEHLCEYGEWHPSWPMLAVSHGLIAAIERSAKALQSCKSISFVGDPPVESVGLPDAARVAERVVLHARWMRDNLTKNTEINIEADCELFKLFDEMEWNWRQLPNRGYEPIYDRAWDDSGICGTCAHNAVHSLRNTIVMSLGSIAARVRSERSSGGWLAQLEAERARERKPFSPLVSGTKTINTPKIGMPWFIPFWTPEARLQAADAVPQLNLPRWGNQLEVERVKLSRMV